MNVPEHAHLLFDLLRWDGPRTSRAEIAALSPATWDSLCDLAATQRVAPLLYARLGEHALLEPAPPAVAARLAGLHRANALRALTIYHEVARIAAQAATLNIPLLALKGIALAAPVYRNAALRFIGDIDMLAPEHQVATLYAALVAAGYHSTTSDRLGATLPMHLPALNRGGAAAVVELHWRLSTPEDRFTVPLDEVWARSEPLALMGCRLSGLAPEDLLLHLCIHATLSHELIGVGLRPLCDLAQLLAAHGPALGWAEILERAARWRCERGVALALRLASDLVGAPVPAWVLNRCGASAIPEAVLAAAQAQLFTHYGDGLAMPAPLAGLAAARGLRERAALLWRRLFVSREALGRQFQLRPGDPRLRLYYLARLATLLRRHTATAVAYARGDAQVRLRAGRRVTVGAWLAEDDGTP